jgi:hypothetical protein
VLRKRELLWIAGAQYHIRVGPVLRIEERIAPDRDRRIGLGDLAELHPDVTLARARAHGFREHANAGLELGGTSSSIACMIEGTPAITVTVSLAAGRPGWHRGRRDHPAASRLTSARTSASRSTRIRRLKSPSR